MTIPSGAGPHRRDPLAALVRDSREAGWTVLVVAPLAWAAVTLVCLGPLVVPATSIGRATAGLFQPTLQFGMLLMIGVIGGVIVLGGGLRMRDLGWSGGKAWTGIVVTAGVWLAVQLIVLASSLVAGRPPSVNTAWSPGPWTFAAGALASQLLGNALAEETMFRGFLLPQLYLRFAGSRKRLQRGIMAWAVIVSQLCFSLLHIPNLHRLGMVTGYPVGKLLVIFALGIFFALLYLRTGNLFVSIGIHALINTPGTVFSSSEVLPQAAVFVIAVVILAAWPWASRRLRGRAAWSGADGGPKALS